MVSAEAVMLAFSVASEEKRRDLEREIEGHKALLEGGDAEIRELAKAELPELRRRLELMEEKLKLQGYITGCYGSLTSFNVLFADPDDQFKGQGD